MKTLFVPCTVDGLHKHTGSAVLRAKWPVKYWEGAEIYNGTQSLAECDLVVFQKAYLSDTSRRLIHKCAQLREATGSPLVAFDLCDPDFLQDGYLSRILDVIHMFDFATAPTVPMVDWLKTYLPTYLIPDRLDPEIIKYAKPEIFDTDTPSLVWAGYDGNRGGLLASGMFTAVQELGLQLTVIGLQKPKPIHEFIEMITEFDVLLNPRPNMGKYRYKSNNKTLLAWACNVAVAETIDELNMLTNTENRRKVIDAARKSSIINTNHIKKSVVEWETIYKKERYERERLLE